MAGPTKSTTSEERNTTVNTTTTTTVHDIGLTGQNAVDALNAIEGGAIVRESIAADLIAKSSADLKSGYNNLGAVTQDVLKNFTQFADKEITGAQNQVQTVQASASSDKMNFVYLTGAALAVVAIMAMKK